MGLGIRFTGRQILVIGLIGKDIQRLDIHILRQPHHAGQRGFGNRYGRLGVDQVLFIVGNRYLHHQEVGFGYRPFLKLGADEFELRIALVHGFLCHLRKIFPIDEVGIGLCRLITYRLPAVFHIHVGPVQLIAPRGNLPFQPPAGVDRHRKAPAVGKGIVVSVGAYGYRPPDKSPPRVRIGIDRIVIGRMRIAIGIMGIIGRLVIPPADFIRLGTPADHRPLAAFGRLQGMVGRLPLGISRLNALIARQRHMDAFRQREPHRFSPADSCRKDKAIAENTG